jgi:hypothetical protein
MPKTKILKRKKSTGSSTNPRVFDAYFNYLPFEKAVIESNGRTPYSNKEVERLASLGARQRQPTFAASAASMHRAPSSNEGMANSQKMLV